MVFTEAQTESRFFAVIRKANSFSEGYKPFKPLCFTWKLRHRSADGESSSAVRPHSKGTRSDLKRSFCKAVTSNTWQSRKENHPPIFRLVSGHVSHREEFCAAAENAL